MSDALHIAIDARWIFPEMSGIGLYTRELIAALARRQPSHRFTLLFNHEDVMARTAEETGLAGVPGFSFHLVARGPYAPADQLLLPALLRRLKVDVFHATNCMMPFWNMSGIRRMVTFHDLIPLLFRDHAPRARKNRFYPVYRWMLNTTAARSDLIVAVSEATRQDILRHLRIPAGTEDKVRVIHEGVDARFQPGEKPSRAFVQFLFVGRRDPYKNLPLVIQAIAELKARGLPARLRVIGADDPRYPEARETATALNLDDHIEWSGYVTDPDLAEAYRTADVFVLPSRYEGFGLPVLEAMASGTPVICSRVSSLPEVAGDAALLIDPSRPDDLVEAMVRLAADPATRARLARAGLEQAAHFSWDTTARATLLAYESLKTNPSPTARS